LILWNQYLIDLEYVKKIFNDFDCNGENE